MAKEEQIKEKIQIATIEQVILAHLQELNEKLSIVMQNQDELMKLAKAENEPV